MPDAVSQADSQAMACLLGLADLMSELELKLL